LTYKGLTGLFVLVIFFVSGEFPGADVLSY